MAVVILFLSLSTSFALVEYTISFEYPYKKKSMGVMSGERLGQGIELPFPIQRTGNLLFKYPRGLFPNKAGIHLLVVCSFITSS